MLLTLHMTRGHLPLRHIMRSVQVMQRNHVSEYYEADFGYYDTSIFCILYLRPCAAVTNAVGIHCSERVSRDKAAFPSTSMVQQSFLEDAFTPLQCLVRSLITSASSSSELPTTAIDCPTLRRRGNIAQGTKSVKRVLRRRLINAKTARQ